MTTRVSLGDNENIPNKFRKVVQMCEYTKIAVLYTSSGWILKYVNNILI